MQLQGNDSRDDFVKPSQKGKPQGRFLRLACYRIRDSPTVLASGVVAAFSTQLIACT